MNVIVVKAHGRWTGAEVVFHIARTIDIFGFETAALKFVENGAIWFAHHIGQNRQAATVGHTNDDILNSQVGHRA